MMIRQIKRIKESFAHPYLFACHVVICFMLVYLLRYVGTPGRSQFLEIFQTDTFAGRVEILFISISALLLRDVYELFHGFYKELKACEVEEIGDVDKGMDC